MGYSSVVALRTLRAHSYLNPLQAPEHGMVSSNDWTPVAILFRKHLELLALLPFLLCSCQADDPTVPEGMTEPRVLASGYWIADGIAVIGEGEFLFADRGG